MPIDFLIDNGSTGSILSSRKFNELRTDLEPLLRPFDTFVYDASGNVIPSHGAVDVKISLGGCDFEQTLIICDIQQDGVIGQNFLLKYAENISYKHGRINTKINEINCWLGDRKSAKCRVIVRKTTTIPSLTASWLPIEIPGSDNLTKFGYVEANKPSNADLAIIPGIMNMSETEKRINVVNQTENPITLYAKQPVGTCEAYADKNVDTRFYQNEMYSTFQDNLNQMETSGNATTHPVPDFSPERERNPLCHGPKDVYTVRTSNSCQNEQNHIDIIDQETPSTVGIHPDSSSYPVYSTNSVQDDNSDRSIHSQMYSTVQHNIYRVGTNENETTRPVPNYFTDRDDSPISNAPKEINRVPTSNLSQDEQNQVGVINQQLLRSDRVHVDNINQSIHSRTHSSMGGALAHPSSMRVGYTGASAPQPSMLGVTQDQDGLLETSTPSQQNNNPPAVPDYMQDMYTRSSVHLSEAEKTQLANLLNEFKNVFAKSSSDLGRCDIIQHSINTGTAFPVRQPARRIPFGKRNVEQEEIMKMLDRGVLEPSNSPWSSPVVLVTKKDGSIRFCVDYRVLNSLTVKDAYPIPRVDECLDALSGSKWYSSMDLNSGFWQVGHKKEDQEKTAFATSLGLFQFTVMPFGLANAPSTFKRLVENIFSSLNWVELLLYMDDIISPCQSIDQGIQRLRRIFNRLRDSHLKLMVSKCTFFQKQAHFLGNVVSELGVSTDPAKLSAIND